MSTPTETPVMDWEWWIECGKDAVCNIAYALIGVGVEPDIALNQGFELVGKFADKMEMVEAHYKSVALEMLGYYETGHGFLGVH